MVDKFLSTEEMAKSYENLEKEFTKKCQELARVKKEMEEKALNEEDGMVAESPVEAPKPLEVMAVNVVEPNQNIVTTNEEVKAQEDDALASSFSLDFRAKASEFLRKTQGAKELAKEMSKILLLDQSLLNCSDPFTVAYALALKEKGSKDVGRSEAKNDEKATVCPTMLEKKAVVGVPLLTNEVVGLTPAKTKPRFKSLEDAREELVRRYFS